MLNKFTDVAAVVYPEVQIPVEDLQWCFFVKVVNS